MCSAPVKEPLTLMGVQVIDKYDSIVRSQFESREKPFRNGVVTPFRNTL